MGRDTVRGEGKDAMAASRLSAQDWDLRLAVYRAFVATGQAPTYIEIARQVGLRGWRAPTKQDPTALAVWSVKSLDRSEPAR